MSILEDLMHALGSDNTDFTPPNSLCPGSCPIGPAACTACLPYKERLKDALYNVDHLEDFYARYEVTGPGAVGATTCPHCGAPSGNPDICEYCGMQIGTDSGKIRVASANDIPDPIIEARDIIYERHSQVVSQYQSSGLLSGLMDLLTGESTDSLGTRMSKEEIVAAAAGYGVSVSAYLSGLDNGTYGRKRETASSGAVTYAYRPRGNPRRPEEHMDRPPQGGTRRPGEQMGGPPRHGQPSRGGGPGGGRSPRGGGPGGGR